MERSAAADALMVEGFLPKAKKALQVLEDLGKRLENDAEFKKLYESDFISALIEAGIDPNARTEMGLAPLERGNIPSRSKSCITPSGNACVCCPD